METQTRLRPPHLQPSWTEPPRSGGGYPPTPYPARDNSMYSPCIRSPNMPRLLYPRSPVYDHSMRRHEQTMVDRLDQRHWPPPPESPSFRPSPRSLSSITELRGNPRRSSIAYSPHSHAYSRSPRSPHRPQHLEYDYPRRQTLADESRSILLSRPPAEPRSSISNSTRLAERRRSLPSSFPAARRAARQRRQELQAWGHVYLGNGLDADCFVSPLSLRKPSDTSSGKEEASESDLEKQYLSQSRLAIRARVRPRALDRKPFILQRTFDMDELRATVPDPDLPPSPASTRRQSVEFTNRTTQQAYDPTKPEREPDKLPSPRSFKTVPIHLQYARTYFPVIAALIYSGHVQTGDIIDFPLPHPEAWSQTVAYVYTGQGELTGAVKQNILYLGGKI